MTVTETDFLSNASGGGSGGAYIRLADEGELLRMDRVRFQDNQAYSGAGALYLRAAGNVTPTARLTNLLFAGNDLISDSAKDAVVRIDGAFTNLEVELAYITAADNSAETFLYAEPSASRPVTVNVTLTNTLLSAFTNGFAAEEFGGGEVTIRHSHTLHQDVTNLHQTVGGSPTFSEVNPLPGDPKLSPSYHLMSGSAAIDAGVDAGVDHDIDGDLRPLGDGFDIGADEFVYYKIYLPLVLR
ncbi:MAG: choice-of-anchor Q domain-containing protein [Anaerolineae bacterium]